MPVFRRRIDIRSRLEGTSTRVRAALEDDFHHFCVELTVDQGKIAQIRGFAMRRPYDLCLQASEPLQALVGTETSAVAYSVMRATNPSLQCTHQLELAGLAMAAAYRAPGARRYDIEVPRRQSQASGVARTTASVQRDGQAVLHWTLEGDVITGPAPYTGLDLKQHLTKFALTQLPTDEAEAALVLRRCAVISIGREYDLDVEDHAHATGLCYVQQPERAVVAWRMKGSTLDFTPRIDQLCQQESAWLAFEAETP